MIESVNAWIWVGFPLLEIGWLFRLGSFFIEVYDVALLEIIEGSPKEKLPEKREMVYGIRTGKGKHLQIILVFRTTL